MAIEMDMVKRIKDCMQQKRLSQSDMARDLGMSRQIVSKWMKSGHIPENRLEEIEKWLRGYNIKVSLSQLKLGPSAKKGDTLLRMIVREAVEAQERVGFYLDKEKAAELIGDCVEQKLPIEFARKHIMTTVLASAREY
jgi:transcriptional regulator with XRE-family HTH domain